MSHEIIDYSRLKLIYITILGLFALIILRLFSLVLFNDKADISKIYDNSKTSRRADIYDRNGVLVATDLKTKSLYASSVLIRSPKEVAAAISSLFSDAKYNEILKKILDGRNSKHWILLRRNLTPMQVEKVEKLHIAGLIFEDDLVRVYPQKSIASHYVGYVDLDRRGLAGIEMQYERQLKLKNNLQIAMDVRVQDILHDELQKGISEFHAKAAGGIVLDINSGEILALSSMPDFDPNLQSDAKPQERFNMITSGVYELGSVMKIFTNAAAFEHDLINPNDVYSVRDPIRYGRFTIKDDHHYKDELTVAEIFAYSSNIGTIKIAEKLGVVHQKDFLRKMGFFGKVLTDFPGLGRPIYPKIWRDINLFTISYGHGIAITPLHLVLGTAAVVNGGRFQKPSFLKLEGKSDGEEVLSSATSAIMRRMMRKVVEEGTGKFANIAGYEVGGKTGTAERAEFGGYNERQTFASFVAAFPISNPKYLVFVAFDRPNSAFNTGGMVAAPVVGKIIRNIAPILGVRPLPANERILPKNKFM